MARAQPGVRCGLRLARSQPLAFRRPGLHGIRPGVKSTPDGWLNRLLGAMPGPHRATDALNIGSGECRGSCTQQMVVANMPMGRGAARPIPLDRPGIEEPFSRLYQGNDPAEPCLQGGLSGASKAAG